MDGSNSDHCPFIAGVRSKWVVPYMPVRVWRHQRGN